MQILKQALALAFICAGAVPATAQDGDPHLNIVPRTDAEAARIAAITAPTTDFTAPEQFEIMQAGGATSLALINSDAFSHSSENLSFEREMDFAIGNGFFKKLWVSSPSATLASNGLGPLFNARSCQRCHLKDGRGHPPEGDGDSRVSMFLRISIPGEPEDMINEIEGYLNTIPDPKYGGQLQDLAVIGHPGEYRLGIEYEEIEVALNGGEVAYLRAPTYTAEDLGYGPLSEGIMLSPRVAPQMIGLGLLEAVPAADILANVDEDDADGDGISGRANIVWAKEFDTPLLGRFGLKAGQPNLRQQNADAFTGDLGISNPINRMGWGDCTSTQQTCRQAPDGGEPIYQNLEIIDQSFDLVTFYIRNLAVPARRDVDDEAVLLGKDVFYNAGCIACHNPKFVTHRLNDRDEHSFQLIWPYSDLLLHDMGEGLADHRPESRADGYEWRTPPLWGIGLTETVSNHTYFLHDGRARNLLEAVLWHGGEAQAARNKVVGLPPQSRDALITFLESL